MCLRKRMGLVVAIGASLRLGSSGRNWGRGFLKLEVKFVNETLTKCLTKTKINIPLF